MHSHSMRGRTETRRLAHFNFLFTGKGSHVYDLTMVRLTRRLYQRVIKDLHTLQIDAGTALDVGTGPGTLVRMIAHHFPQFEVYGIDLSENMIDLAREHARRERLEERVHFNVGDVAHLPYPDASFDLIVSTISMHHWHDLELPLQELYRVLRPGGKLWIYDFRFVKRQEVEKAQALTSFAGIPLERQLLRTGFLQFALYQRFALRKIL